ncbi:MAG: hypothetical protein GY809_17355 [Planctomycetes bacterium]|nr:hypothetical protein [Planctomycetota bacterium]
MTMGKYCLLALALIAGCRTSVNTQSHFVLHAERSDQADTGQAKGILDVHRITIDRTYDFKGFVYRKAGHEFEIDYYNGFLVSPAQMITERARHWLSRANLFERVLNPASQADPTHALEGHILKLYGVFKEDEPFEAVFEVKFFLIDHQSRTGQVILIKTYGETEPMETQDAACFVEAVDRCLERILTSLERDVAQALQS